MRTMINAGQHRYMTRIIYLRRHPTHEMLWSESTLVCPLVLCLTWFMFIVCSSDNTNDWNQHCPCLQTCPPPHNTIRFIFTQGHHKVSLDYNTFYYCTYGVVTILSNHNPGRPFHVSVTSTLGLGWMTISSLLTREILPPPCCSRSRNLINWSSSLLICWMYSRLAWNGFNVDEGYLMLDYYLIIFFWAEISSIINCC